MDQPSLPPTESPQPPSSPVPPRKVLKLLPMIAGLVIVVLVIGAFVVFRHRHATVQNNTNTATATKPAKVVPKLKLSDNKYYPSAHIVSEASLSAEAQKALIGFTLKQEPAANGGTLFSLSTTKKPIKTITVTSKPGQKVYFVDTVQAHKDTKINGLFLVDADGYIITWKRF